MIALGLVGVLLPAGICTSSASAATNCSTASNPVVCENALPGAAPSQWQVKGIGDTSIQGYATQMSVNAGQTIYFKIKTPSTNYTINIYRLGYYGGDGARLIASGITPTATLPQTQPACLTQSSTGLIDCGNWGISAHWQTPATLVSGVYIADLIRHDSADPGGMSQIPFVIRNDSSHSPVLVTTDDATWQAYNAYGGNSLYSCTIKCPRGGTGSPQGEAGGYKAAYAVSYNRPWDGSLVTDAGQSYLWYAEYQMVRWLEQQGYNASYTTDVQLGTGNPRLLRNHRVILFSGHDEYWSAGERANVTAARNAGVNLAMFSGSSLFWKTRWGRSVDSSHTRNRTLITYKETHFNAPTDPTDPPNWTGTWADPRFTPPAHGGDPGNSLTGQVLEVNSGNSVITVPYRYHNLPVWNHTSVANLKPGRSVTLGSGAKLLGFEWDVVPDNGFQPPGEFLLSSTAVQHVHAFSDYGTYTTSATETHHLSLYRASSGALVFDAGTVRWSWGLALVNAWGYWSTQPGNNPPDPNMEQFTVNLLSMMGVRPGSLQRGLTAGPQPSSARGPRSSISNPRRGAKVADGARITARGSAVAAHGQVVSGVEVSTDGGHSWHPATVSGSDATRVHWSYHWIAHGYPHVRILARAVDGYGHLGRRTAARVIGVHCPCSFWGPHFSPESVPFGHARAADRSSVEVGMRFTTKIRSKVLGIRFYKGSGNWGPHVGSIWTNHRKLLAHGTFKHERRTGWQKLTFHKPVILAAHHTYVVGYFDPHGHYAYTIGWFYRSPAPTPLGGATTSSGPWSAVINTGSHINGLYTHTTKPAFPRHHFQATNYWVDPILQPAPRTVRKRHHPRLRGRSAKVGNRQAKLTPKVHGSLRRRHGRVCVAPKAVVSFKLTTRRLRRGVKANLHHEELLLGHRRKASKAHGPMHIRLRHLRVGSHAVVAKLVFTTRHSARVHRKIRVRFHVC